jgi:signal transduction histidine kinase
MALSYVLISAVAVLLVEAIVAVVVPMAVTSNVNLGPSARAEMLAKGMAAGLGLVAADVAAQRGDLSDQALLAEVARRWSGQAGSLLSGTDVRAVAGPDGRLVSASVPPAYPAGSTPPGLTAGTSARSGPVGPWVSPGGPRKIDVVGRPAIPLQWATSPILVGGDAIGVVYVQDSSLPIVHFNWSSGGGWLTSAALATLLLIPLCAGFGLLSMRRLISRIRRLAAGAAAMAGGDLRSRVPVSGGDEVGQLEEGFNLMGERVEAASRAERDAAGAEARLVERTRIARELHDSISQDLFSLSLLAGNLRRTLPDGSRHREQAETMEQTIDHTMREMRTMLLELRPVALAEMGLAPALRELCQAYEVRLGIAVHAELGAVELDPATEHTVLRVVQESLSNAARHGGAQAIEVVLAAVNGTVEVLVRDDGRGFDPEQAGDRHGMGLGLMRERVTELGGTIEVTSRPDNGTTVRARIPGGTS